MSILSVNSLKGGTGKTSTAINLAGIWGEKKRSLLVDFDPQANASTGMGIIRPYLSIADVLVGDCTVKNAIVETPYMDVLPSNISLAQLDNDQLDVEKLKQIIRPLEKIYSMIVIDSSPSLSVLSVSVLVAAQAVISPCKPSVYDTDGLDKLILETIPEAKRSGLNRDLRMLGIFYSDANTRTKLFKTIDDSMRENHGSLLFKTVIHSSVKIGEAPLFGKPIHAYNKFAAREYYSLSKEVMQRWQTV